MVSKNIVLLFFAFGMTIFVANAQRRPLDSLAIANWPYIFPVKLSSDGTFTLYLAGRGGDQWKTLSVVSTDGQPKVQMNNVREAFFIGNSKYVVAQTKGDSVMIIDLMNDTHRAFGSVKSLVVPKGDQNNGFAFKLLNGELVLGKANGDNTDTLGQVSRAEFDPSGRWLLWCNKTDEGLERWSYIDCETHARRTFWIGTSMGTIGFEGVSGKIAFLAKSESGDDYSIWKYNMGADCAQCWLKSTVDQRGDSMVLENSRLDFLPGVQGWLFHVHKQLNESAGQQKTSDIKVWRYNDEYGSPATKLYLGVNLDKNRSFLAIGYERPSRIVTLGMDGDAGADPVLSLDGKGGCAVTSTAKNRSEEYRLVGERPDVYVINLKDGSRKCVKRGLEYGTADIGLSPAGKYVWWYDRIARSYFTYSTATGKVNNVGKDSTSIWYEWDNASDPFSYGLGGWLEGDKGMLVYDHYDIWRLDPQGVAAPKNITNGFGKSHKMRMRLVSYYSPVEQTTSPLIKEERPLVATLDDKTKANGFFRISVDGKADPEQECLLNGEICYYPESISFVTFPYSVIKAEDADVFLVQKMSAEKFPNFYTTRDFRRFVPMSTMAPEKKYNWLTSELVHWKTFKGRDGSAIVYKPTDFDSTRKYPVIFYCYQTLTPGLNLYEYPEYSTGPINIPWFVSHGYVVVCPDIHYTVGNPGEGIYDYMVSGVNYMKGKRWVAADRIGVEGHSWGGFEVNYLITRTNAFRCAVSASGMSNLSSNYGLEGFSGCSGPSFTETGDYMGGVLSDSVERYVENSPVFNARKIKTPLLLMSNDKDHNVPWEQGVEIFTSLRRMQKKVWLLEYPNEAHELSPKNAWDFTKRLTAYFDYYLKDGPEPDWMTGPPKGNSKYNDSQ